MVCATYFKAMSRLTFNGEMIDHRERSIRNIREFQISTPVLRWYLTWEMHALPYLLAYLLYNPGISRISILRITVSC